MPTREEMQSLTQEIIGSHEARTAGIASLRKTTQDQLRELDSAHQTMAQELRVDLAKGRSDLTASVISQLSDLANAHQQMAQEIRADLAKGRSYLTASVVSQLSDLANAHQQMAQEIRADLAKGRSDLTASVVSQLSDLANAHQQMAQELRADLAKGHSDLTDEVNAWMKEIATAHAQIREEWQNMATVLQVKRGGGTTLAEAPEPAPVEKATEVPKPGATEEMAPQTFDLGGRVFDYLANRPGGAKLAEMEQEFGLSRIEMARAVRTLMDEDRVEKRDLLYSTV